MSLTTNLKLDKTIIPCVPFLWYREGESVCPIDLIKEVTGNKIKELYNIETTKQNVYVLIQRHISERENIYLCLHSLMYYEMHKTTEIKDNLLIVPDRFIHDLRFSVKTIPLNGTEIKERPGGLRIGEFTTGCVFIYNTAFSPPGCLHFKVNNDAEKSEFLCHIKCEQLNIDIECLFILFNYLKEENIEDLVKNEIAKFV
ncbi:hypothetical protein QKU48_gp0891 [Fadolivirus algeromassiliense]|jgi:hypothetical protein|uniref:Uncharacterized protein n=1 Tax=Fadolivirus FV1/VV64 TaxID=3070911 RepID=A0A7D3UVP3_9VIRU|nr:hypothetical protein QKU48_gp0891 [Fadolivirus algeromassiliense]QKF94349.1 hypothetical protein Fadolivirus_1_891 [Fadolivirus FV1/VV64]